MFDEGTYSPAQLRRNRLIVGGLTIAAVAACLIGAAVTSWPWPNALGIAAVAVFFGASLWWAIASRKAGPLSINPGAWKRLRNNWSGRR